MPEGQQALDPSALAAIQPRPGFALAAHAPTTLSLAAERSFRRYCQNVAHRDWPRPHNCHGLKRGYRTSEDLAEVLAARPAKWFLSARDARAPARSGSGQRPPIGIGPLPFDHNPASRQQPDQRNARSFAGGKIAPGVGPASVLALRAIGQFGRVDIGDAHALAAATDRVAVVDRRRQTQGGGSENDRHEAYSSRSAPQRQCPHTSRHYPWPRSSPAGPASHAGELGWAAVRQHRRAP